MTHLKVTVTQKGGKPVTREEALALAQLAIGSMSVALERGLTLPLRDDERPDANPLNESGGSK